MTKEQEALKLALEVLEAMHTHADVACVVTPDGTVFLQPAITAIKEARAQPAQVPVAWIDLLKQAEEIVRSNSLWKKYIDGTPLANDIAVWMADFAQEHATPPATQPDAFEQGRQEGMKQERALWTLTKLGQEIEAQTHTHTLNSTKTVAVATDTYWLPIDKDTPRSAKLQLLSIGGVAQYGTLGSDVSFYTHWSPLPKRRKE